MWIFNGDISQRINPRKMGKSTISMAIFHRYVSSPEGNIPSISPIFYLHSYPMTDPWCCYIWCSMDPIKKYPSHVCIGFRRESKFRLHCGRYAAVFGSKSAKPVMPGGGPLCNRCRSGLPSDGDTWCQLCSCASALSEAGKYRFQSLAHRALAEEIVLQASRQVQALVQLDRQVHSERTSLSDRLANTKSRLEEVTNQVNRSAVPKSGGGRPPAPRSEPPPVKAESGAAGADSKPAGEEVDFGSESFEEESEEEVEAEEDPSLARAAPEGASASAPAREPRSPSRPPLPRQPPKKRKRSRSRGRRGGRKHSQQYRALQNPDLRFHRPQKIEPIELGGDNRRRRPQNWRWDGGVPFRVTRHHGTSTHWGEGPRASALGTHPGVMGQVEGWSFKQDLLPTPSFGRIAL